MPPVYYLRTTALSLIFATIMVTTIPYASTGLAAEKPPLAKKVPKEIITHGDKRVDDYFWLREKTNAEVVSYLEAENAYADAVMQPSKPFEERLYREMLGHLKETDSSAPVRRSGFLYYSRTEEGKN